MATSEADLGKAPRASALPAASSAAAHAIDDELRCARLLLELDERLVPDGDPQLLYQDVLRTAMQLGDADAGTVQILDLQTGELALIATHGIDDALRQRFARLDASSDTSCGTALREGRRTLLHFDEQVPDPKGDLEAHRRAGLRSALSTPLLTRGGKPIGMLSLHFRKRHDLPARQLRYLDLLARRAGDLIDRKRLDDALRASEARLSRELEEVTLLQEISTRLVRADDVGALHEQLLDTAVALMRSDCGSVQVLDEESNELHLLAWQGFEPEAASHWMRIPDDDPATVCSHALRDHRRVLVRDVENFPPLQGTPDLEHMRRCGIRAVQSTPLLSRSGKPVGMLSTHWSRPHLPSQRDLHLLDVVARQAADLIERRRAEDRLRESEGRLRLLVQSVAQAVWEADADGAIVRDSPSWRAFTGQDSEELLGDGWLGAVHPADREWVRCKWRDAVASRGRFDAECRLRGLDGGWRWTNLKATPVLDENGNVRKWLGMNIDVSARKTAEAALRDADRRKDEFLATLAHELRNPLAPLRHGLQIARRTANVDPALPRVVEMMDRQLTHLVRLVDDLLDVGRIQSGKLELRKRPVALEQVLTSSLEAARATLEAHGHAHELQLVDRGSYVLADFDRLVQVFSNLLANAAKYSGPGAPVVVRVEHAGGDVVVRVTDRGIGIPRDDLPHVFDLFSQVREHQGRADGGLGIGLAIVRRLVGLHGGTVTAASEGPGLGSTFSVRLPRIAAPADAAGPGAATGTGGEVAPHRVLVVDDNADAADSLAALLRMHGQEVSVARDGLEAIREAQRVGPEVIFLDLGMPRLDGIEAARRIRSLPGGATTWICALTGWGQARDRQRTLEAGFDQHLVKPVDEGTLVAVLRQLDAPRPGPTRATA
jgi:PAS domain S-box-containing protein